VNKDSDERAEPSAQDRATPRRPIRSYVLRAGRLGPGQARALSTLGPRYVLPFQSSAPDWDAVFGRQAPRILEIGFGMGDATAAVASALPGSDFIGVEVHEAGVGALLKLIGERQLTNIRIVQHDAVEVLRDMLPDASLAGVHLWFPDPWHKKRHHKRRLVQPAFVQALIPKLMPGGYLHMATDWEDYATQMLSVLGACQGLQNRHGGYAPRPAWRPLTRFEARGQRLGHGVWDLVFERA
jgi:tRNA (guanine-N7-)-methyltransferase